MLWWDWTTKQRLVLVAGMVAVAAIPCVLLGRSTTNWPVIFGGTATLTILQMVGWFLFVGLRTGRIPARSGSEVRSESPGAFWIVAGGYVVTIALFLSLIITILRDFA